MLPSIRLGGPAVFLAADSAWRLLAVSADGCVRLWNLRLMSLELETSVAPLLLGTNTADRGVAPTLSPSLGASNSYIVEIGITVGGSFVSRSSTACSDTAYFFTGYFFQNV